MGESDNSNNAGQRAVNVEREQRILDAAARLMIHYGFDKTTVSDIAREARVSKGAVYLHWPSKNELFMALLVRETKVFTEKWLKLVLADPEGGKLSKLYLHSLTVLAESPLLRAMMTQDKRVMGDFIHDTDAAMLARKNFYTLDLVRMLQATGGVRPELDPKVVAYILSCVGYGFLMVDEFVPPEDVPPIEDVITGLADFLDKAVTPADGGNQEAMKQVILSMVAALEEQWAQGNLM